MGNRFRELGKLGGFLLVGFPTFFVAVPLNFALVHYAGVPKPVAYAAVLLFQVTVNFFLCRWLVFAPGNHMSARRQFAEFMVGILGFRLADWLLYSLLVQLWPNYYLVIQVCNVLLFAVLKYKFSKHVIEGQFKD